MAEDHSFHGELYLSPDWSFTVKAFPVGPLEAFENERQDGTHKQAVLPDLLTGIPGSLMLFNSHNISHFDSVH